MIYQNEKRKLLIGDQCIFISLSQREAGLLLYYKITNSEWRIIINSDANRPPRAESRQLQKQLLYFEINSWVEVGRGGGQ